MELFYGSTVATVAIVAQQLKKINNKNPASKQHF